jgi:hypothetical protein
MFLSLLSFWFSLESNAKKEEIRSWNIEDLTFQNPDWRNFFVTATAGGVPAVNVVLSEADAGAVIFSLAQ